VPGKGVTGCQGRARGEGRDHGEGPGHTRGEPGTYGWRPVWAMGTPPFRTPLKAQVCPWVARTQTRGLWLWAMMSP